MAFGNSFNGGVSGGSVNLLAPPTNIGTTTPPAITVSTLFRSANAGNVPFIANPSGTGAFQLQVADSTATGGNARGANSIDLQSTRSLASQVASGASSVAIGDSNTASSSYSVAIGGLNISSNVGSVALGYTCIASGNTSFAVGNNNLASGFASAALGVYSSTKGVGSLLAIGAALSSSGAKAQTTVFTSFTTTTDATPTALKTDINAASAANQLVLQDNSAIAFLGVAVATITGAGNTASWLVQGCIKRGAGAASTVLVGTPTSVSIGANAGAAAWTLAITADTTNGCLAATATNGAGVTVRVVLSLFSAEAAF